MNHLTLTTGPLEYVPKPQTFDWLPEGMEALADGEYDAIVMGTGLKECVISGLLRYAILFSSYVSVGSLIHGIVIANSSPIL